MLELFVWTVLVVNTGAMIAGAVVYALIEGGYVCHSSD